MVPTNELKVPSTLLALATNIRTYKDAKPQRYIRSRHNSSCTVFWVSSFHLSINIVVLYQFTVPGHVYRKLHIQSWSVRSLGRKKGSRLQLCFWVVSDVPEQKGMDLWKQMSSSKCSFTCICGIFLPLNPSTTTVYARSAFYPSLRFTLSLQSAFYTQSAFYPWSAVCSPQFAVCILHWPFTVFKSLVCSSHHNSHVNSLRKTSMSFFSSCTSGEFYPEGLCVCSCKVPNRVPCQEEYNS